MNEIKQIYESKKVVRNYIKGFNKLMPAEKILYDSLVHKLSRNAMLDLGVGAGRTTRFFAPRFNKYIGVDISYGMIEACKKIFRNLTNAEFIIANAASLPPLSVNKFDFIMFSFNGIDYLTLDERILFCADSYNLLENDGIFAFSTHNANAIKRLYRYRLPSRTNPLGFITEIFHYIKIRKINGSMNRFLNKSFFHIYDGGEYFKALTAYILPSYQISILKNAGFNKVETIDMKGNYIPVEKADLYDNEWIHYICHKN